MLRQRQTVHKLQCPGANHSGWLNTTWCLKQRIGSLWTAHHLLLLPQLLLQGIPTLPQSGSYCHECGPQCRKILTRAAIPIAGLQVLRAASQRCRESQLLRGGGGKRSRRLLGRRRPASNGTAACQKPM